MRKTMASALLFLIPLSVGCAIADKQSIAREAANDLNLNSRFDRTQLVTEHVAAQERAEYMHTHHSWGGEVRVTDAEVAGFKMVNSNEAEVRVHVSWFLLGEGELRSTVLKQRFQDDKKGNFMLVSEERLEGDIGLLGERFEHAAAPPEMLPPPPQFPTVRIGQNE
jgi:hypothetical protein